MKTIIVISSTPFWGGAETFILNTLARLSKFYNIYYIVNNNGLAKKLPVGSTFLFKKKSYFQRVLEVKRLAKKVSADILMFNGSNIVYSLPLFWGYNKIYYRHTTNLYVPRSRRWLFRLIMRIVYMSADLSIHVSEYSLSEQSVGKGLCIHNGIQTLDFLNRREIGKRKPVKFLFCGRLEIAKGIRQIVKAFSSISPEVAILTIIGDGSEREWVKRNLGESIKYLGFQSDVSKFYEDSDALILMSEFENFPISIIEAMNHGLSIITTGVGGISEMVKDGFNGFVVQGNVESIRNIIDRICANPGMLQVMGENSYNFCKRSLDVEHKISEIYNAIELVLNK